MWQATFLTVLLALVFVLTLQLQPSATFTGTGSSDEAAVESVIDRATPSLDLDRRDRHPSDSVPVK